MITPPVLKVLLDLNVWCAALLAEQVGRNGTACQLLVDTVRSGTSSLGPIQLVISWGSLNRLRKVLIQDLKINLDVCNDYLKAVQSYAELGPFILSPTLTLGGIGVIPLRDEEDRHVLETALAAKTDYLVTMNLRDFQSKDCLEISPHLLQYQALNHTLYIIHPYLMAASLRVGSLLAVLPP